MKRRVYEVKTLDEAKELLDNNEHLREIILQENKKEDKEQKSTSVLLSAIALLETMALFLYGGHTWNKN